MPRISVVIPVYNVEKYIGQCLGSVRDQTFGDFEAIVVNDGSLDGSRAIVQEFVDEDPRFRVLDQEDLGVSNARNRGIREASGDIVCFLDADDYLEASAFERIDAAFASPAPDVVRFGANAVPKEDSYPWLERQLCPRRVRYDGFVPELCFDEVALPYIWCVAVRRSALLASGVLFDEGLSMGEDQVFLLELYPRVRSVSFVPERLYDYRVTREGSLMASRRGPEDIARGNLAIVQRVLASWAEQGISQRYAKSLLVWSVRLAAYTALRQEPQVRAEIAGDLRKFWFGALGRMNVMTLELPTHVRPMVDAVLSIQEDGSCVGGESVVRNALRLYRLREYGLADLVDTSWRRVRGALGKVRRKR